VNKPKGGKFADTLEVSQMNVCFSQKEFYMVRPVICILFLFFGVGVSVASDAPISDDFNSEILKPVWNFLAPSGGTYSLEGAGTGDAILKINVPSGATYNLWSTKTAAPMLVQLAPAGDFEVEARFVTIPGVKGCGEGLIIRETAKRFIRFDFSYTTSLRFIVATVLDGVASKRVDVAAPVETRLLRLTRIGTTWTFWSSVDGTIWAKVASFVLAFNPVDLGLYALNDGGTLAPAYSASIDYFFNVASPIIPEDALPAPPPAPVTSIVVAWVPVTTDVEGNAESISGYEVATSAPTVDLNSGGLTILRMEVPVGSETGTEILSLVRAVRPETTCRAWVRARDTDGNWSDWSIPLVITVPKDITPPSVPMGVRVR
jgi:hypothetical protein